MKAARDLLPEMNETPSEMFSINETKIYIKS